MFTTVHKTFTHTLYVVLLSALFFTSAVPSVVRSQEEVITPVTTQSTVPQNPYKVEGVPGGGTVIGDFVVGPGKVDLTIAPGETKIVEITVTNRTGQSRLFNLTTEDATGSQTTDNSIILLGSDRGPYSLKDYLKFEASSFQLEHATVARIPIRVSIPADAEPGGLYGSVLIDTLTIAPEDDISGGTTPQSAVVARIGTLFFITIPGEVERNTELKNFSTIPERTFYQSGPIKFGILHENTGSIHTAPYGEIRITNIFNEEVGQITLEPWFVLPQSVRLREVSWNRDFLFGKYTATLYVNRSYDDIVDEASYTIWVLPWKLVAGVFIVLFLIFFVIRAFFRTFEFKRKV